MRSTAGTAPQGETAPVPQGETAPAPQARHTHDIVVVGASAGGVVTLQALAARLPADLGAAVLVVQHLSAEWSSELAAMLGRAGSLPAANAEDGMPIEPGRILVAPPDRHVLVEPGRVRVVRGPHENRHRPAIDPLFRSAAWAYGPRVVGIVLSGGLDDGTAGLWAIKSCGGTTVVQEPADALHPDMPSSALMHNRVDHRLPLVGIAELVARLAREPIDAAWAGAPKSIATEVNFARLNGRGIEDVDGLGLLSPFTCPTCRGALWEIDEASHLRYRCHTGHAFSHGSLTAEQGLLAEQAVYTALRAVEQKAAALRRLTQQWQGRYAALDEDYGQRARDLDATAETLRRLLAGSPL
jgi:two-component system chemotaxis response regulator CheB